MTHITDTLHQDHEKVSQLISELKRPAAASRRPVHRSAGRSDTS